MRYVTSMSQMVFYSLTFAAGDMHYYLIFFKEGIARNARGSRGENMEGKRPGDEGA